MGSIAKFVTAIPLLLRVANAAAIHHVLTDSNPAVIPRVVPVPTEVPVIPNAPITGLEIAARPAGVQSPYEIPTDTTCSVFVPFTNTGSGSGKWPDDAPPRIYMDVDGKNIYRTPAGLQIDTGSTGFQIGKETWEAQFKRIWATTDKSIPGWKYLSSSDILYTGYWVNVNVTFKDLSWTSLMRAELPVLVYDKRTNCSSVDNTTGVCGGPGIDIPGTNGALMGIGYGRRADGMNQCTPSTNPLLNVKGVWQNAPGSPCTYRNGYIITKDGIQWGLTPSNTANFKFHTLNKWSSLDMDWAMARSCLGINAITCRDGDFLPDTGISKSYVSSPDIPSGNPSPPTGGLSIKLSLPDAGQQMGYFDYLDVSSAAGDVEPVSFKTTRTTTSLRVYLNTGSHFFNGFETAYDADRGFYGIRAL
ncbi:hypothetical protein H072_3642 [Dactylellina haptotyla CBS 200.50]|uniref:Peptidase A1 domain-containing protein n=1 Tax=Dactylellina haptotyla (strain CBS 200.50) TaxID=1284197 RepID=S8AHD4_DACHA|nr:hypothetical protein H072_3642 [Dactylellina haptotyla CBS 200.50]